MGKQRLLERQRTRPAPSRNVVGVVQDLHEAEDPWREGTGLGLWISRSQVQRYGSNIRAGNRSSGGAAVCTLAPPHRHLPVVQPVHHGARSLAWSHHHTPGEAKAQRRGTRSKVRA